MYTGVSRGNQRDGRGCGRKRQTDIFKSTGTVPGTVEKQLNKHPLSEKEINVSPVL